MDITWNGNGRDDDTGGIEVDAGGWYLPFTAKGETKNVPDEVAEGLLARGDFSAVGAPPAAPNEDPTLTTSAPAETPEG